MTPRDRARQVMVAAFLEWGKLDPLRTANVPPMEEAMASYIKDLPKRPDWQKMEDGIVAAIEEAVAEARASAG